jgi:hypothetical protein
VAEQLDIFHSDIHSVTIVPTMQADPRTRRVPDVPEQLVVREARRRQRRRQFVVGITTLAIAATAFALWMTVGSGGQNPVDQSHHAGGSETPLPRLVSSALAKTASARTAAFVFTWRTSATSVHGSGSVNFASPSYSIDETMKMSGLFTLFPPASRHALRANSQLFGGSTRLTRTASGHLYEQAAGKRAAEENGSGLLPQHPASATENKPIAILARSPAGYAFGLLSIVPASRLRLDGVGTGEVGGMAATTYLFGYSGRCQGSVQTEIWTTQGRIMRVTTTQRGSGGKLLETMSLTLAHFGLPVVVVAPTSVTPGVTTSPPHTHVESVTSTGSVRLVPICSP